MGFDWEDILGDTSYEDAVDIAARALEKMQDDELEPEEEAQDGEADAESTEGSAKVTEAQTEHATREDQKSENVCEPKQFPTGARFMDGCDDEPVFN